MKLEGAFKEVVIRSLPAQEGFHELNKYKGTVTMDETFIRRRCEWQKIICPFFIKNMKAFSQVLPRRIQTTQAQGLCLMDTYCLRE